MSHFFSAPNDVGKDSKYVLKKVWWGVSVSQKYIYNFDKCILLTL
jgi:hypothetical protein